MKSPREKVRHPRKQLQTKQKGTYLGACPLRNPSGQKRSAAFVPSEETKLNNECQIAFEKPTFQGMIVFSLVYGWWWSHKEYRQEICLGEGEGSILATQIPASINHAIKSGSSKQR